jgi:hypothetical protein
MRILLALWCGLIAMCGSLHATPADGKNGSKDSLKMASSPAQNLDLEASSIQQHTFPELEKYLKENGVSSTIPTHIGYAAPEFTKEYIAKTFTTSEYISNARDQAQGVINEIERKGSFVDLLSTDNIIELPVGIKKKFGNSTVILAVGQAKLYPTYTELLVFCKMDLPQGKSIFFGANNIKISHGGGIVGNWNLTLLGDFQIPINGGNSMITLKGGFDMATGVTNNLTYVSFDCGGVKDVNVMADVSFPRSLLTPLNSDYSIVNDQQEKVIGTFTVQNLKDWNNMLAGINFTKPFAIKGIEKVAFEVTDAKFDFSDFANNVLPNEFPPNYGNITQGQENLWRGVFIRSIKVILPKEFRKRGTTERVTFTGQNLLFDNWGFSGLVSGTNILQTGSASGWDFSVDKFEIEVQANRLRSAGFEGSIAIPLSKKTATGLVKDYGLAYRALFSADNGYLLNVGLTTDIPFDLWQAKGKLAAGSFVELTVKDDKFRPRAFLNGELNIGIGDGTVKEASLSGIKFQGLQLQTEVPYIKADYFGYQSTNNKVANFPITLNTLSFSLSNNNEVGLWAGLNLNLMEESANKIQASAVMGIVGKLVQDADGVSYQYDRFEVTKVGVAADFKGFTIDGEISMLKNHPIMGTGFAGSLGITLKLMGDGVRVDAVAAFGKIDGNADDTKNYRYWYVDLLVGGLNIPVGGPAFIINGLGGGASYHMKKSSTPLNTWMCPSGLKYVPDLNTGLGVRLSALFTVGGKTAVVGKATLEMTFTTSWGVQKIGFHGKAIIMPNASQKVPYANKTNLENSVKTNYTSLVTTTTDPLKEADYNAKVAAGNFKALGDGYSPLEAEDREGSIVASMGIEYDFQNKALDGNFEVYMNIAGGFLTGVGTNGLAGWAKIRFAPNRWYVLVGTPQNPIGVSMTLGFANITTKAYFMVGDSLGASPPPPSAVANILGVKLQSLDYMRNLNDLGGGRGLAFGASLSVNTGELNFLIFYAKFQAGIGFDIMVKDYGNTVCAGGSGRIGMNGWYANGQAYAYLQGELGVKVNLLFIKGNFPIITAGAAVLLQAKLPNPSWFAGYVAGRFSLLGGLVEGGFSCRIQFGSECTPAGGAAIPKFEMISDILPDDKGENVSVLTNIQVAFRLPLETTFNGNDYDAQGTPLRYNATLKSYGLWDQSGQFIEPKRQTYGYGADTYIFKTDNELSGNTKYKFKVSVEIREIPSFILVATEEKIIEFTTGGAPLDIPLSNIAATYPVVGHKYMLPKETTTGFIKLKQTQSQLLSVQTGPKAITVQFVDKDNVRLIKPCTYNDFYASLEFGLPILALDKEYTAEVWSGATKIFDYKFKTSKHNTFAEKMAAKVVSNYVTADLGLAGKALGNNVTNSEPFDGIDLKGSRFTNFKPLIESEAVLTDDYFTNTIDPMIYKPVDEAAKIYQPITLQRAGEPAFNYITALPVKCIEVDTEYIKIADTTINNTLLNTVFPYKYMLPKCYYEDFKAVKNYVLEKYGTKTIEITLNQIPEYSSKVNSVTGAKEWYWFFPKASGSGSGGMYVAYPYPIYFKALMAAANFPQITYGNYPAKFMYKVNGSATSSTNFIFKYGDGTTNPTTTQPVLLSAKVFLGGAYDKTSGQMRANLSSSYNIIPRNSPYTGTSDVAAAAVLGYNETSDAIVDWVLIELRSESNPATIVSKRAALLQSDGDIVDVDGISPVELKNTQGRYHITIRHRNHLGFRTQTAINFTGGSIVTADFTQVTGTPVYNKPSATNTPLEVIGNKRVMWSGDVNGDGVINSTDYSLQSNSPTFRGSYNKLDTDLDGDDDKQYNSNQVDLDGPFVYRPGYDNISLGQRFDKAICYNRDGHVTFTGMFRPNSITKFFVLDAYSGEAKGICITQSYGVNLISAIEENTYYGSLTETPILSNVYGDVAPMKFKKQGNTLEIYHNEVLIYTFYNMQFGNGLNFQWVRPANDDMNVLGTKSLFECNDIYEHIP